MLLHLFTAIAIVLYVQSRRIARFHAVARASAPDAQADRNLMAAQCLQLLRDEYSRQLLDKS
ncbi:MAG TPA: hypothetical protein VGF75_00360 [Candidatus Saccharimonadales bacterium]|jgi:hypothetical protein